jgi:hypothetical protein
MPALSAQPFRASQGHHLRLRTAEHLSVERKRYDHGWREIADYTLSWLASQDL